MVPSHVYLVPGFFGFANLGDLVYFGHLHRVLDAELKKRGVAAQLHVVAPSPAASLPRRAQQLLTTVRSTAGEEGALHFIGHSSGGLDVRLLLCPGSTLDQGDVLPQALASRVRTALTVATPHRGTPVASFFTTLLGQRLLRLFSVASMHALRLGDIPLSALKALAGSLAGGKGDVEGLSAELLGDFTEGTQQGIASFLEKVGEDQGLMLQLSPESMELFNASTVDRPTVRYASIVTRARAPGLGSRLGAGLSPSAHATHTLFAALYHLAAQSEERGERRASELTAGFGAAIASADNDGVVPTLSQPWGEVLACAPADHLDVLGHFHGPDEVPPHHDWLCSGSGFSAQGFARVWGRAADFLAGSC